MSRRRRGAVVAVGAVVVAVAAFGCGFVQMPGRSHQGALAALDDGSSAVRDQLGADIEALAVDIGPRHHEDARAALDRAAAFVRTRFTALGYSVVTRAFVVDTAAGAVPFENLEVEIAGSTQADEIVIVGAHYDTAYGTPGANDNASGVAVLFALAEALRGSKPERTVRFVAFANEEPPYFNTPDMGSVRYARGVKARGERVVAMLSLETLGCYFDDKDSQKYPFPFGLLYPSEGNFVGFVSDMSSVSLTRRVVGSFRAHAAFPSEGAAIPGFIPGVYWSDHASFWAIGVPAVMVTDTAPFRYVHYHEPSDVPARVDLDRLARVTQGLVGVVDDLCRGPLF
jgi:hypothetical protein